MLVHLEAKPAAEGTKRRELSVLVDGTLPLREYVFAPEDRLTFAVPVGAHVTCKLVDVDAYGRATQAADVLTFRADPVIAGQEAQPGWVGWSYEAEPEPEPELEESAGPVS